jgi:hypothetical protein
MTDAVTRESNEPNVTPVTSVTRNDAPLSNAERQRAYRDRQRLKKSQATQPSPKPPRPKRGGHKPGGSERYQAMKRQAEEADRQHAETQASKPRKPSVYYSDAIADSIIERLERGEPLRSICSTDDMPDQAAVYKWAAEMPDTFGQRYVRARELGYLKMADELDDLADGSELGERRFEPGVVQRHRLQVDTRRWLLSKCLPKIFGDKLDVTSAGKPLAAASDLDIAKALAHALLPALPAPEPIDVEAVPVKEEGER